MKEFETVLKEFSGEYSEKRSRFIAKLLPCKTEKQAADIIQKIKSENFGANHNVYAYVFSNGSARFSDDGEPHGTAGKPVLEVIQGSKLKDVIIVVTRYFGGVLLGTGGLVKAYTTAAQNALMTAERVKMCECTVFEAECSYSDKDKLISVVEKYGGNVINTEYTENVSLEFSILSSSVADFEPALKEAFSGKMIANIKEIGIFPIKI